MQTDGRISNRFSDVGHLGKTLQSVYQKGCKLKECVIPAT